MAARIQVTMRMTIASPTLVRTDHRSWLCMSLLSFGYSELTRRFFALLIGSLFSADIQNKGFAIAAEFPKPQLSRNRGFVGIRIFQGANRKLIYPSQFRIKAVPLCVRGSIGAPSPGEFGRRGEILPPGGSQNSSGRLSMRWVPPTR